MVSMPSRELFESQKYRDSVLPPEITARVAVEAASRQSVSFGTSGHRDSAFENSFNECHARG
ncbi:transketolase-like TK C-terminal-containing protein [Methylobacter tundripaludum]